MEIRIDNLRDRPRELAFEEPVAAFPLLSELAEQGKVVFTGNVSAKLVATLVGTLAEVDGQMSCTVLLSCSRCLQPMEQRLDLQVALSFSRQAPAVAETNGEVELTEDEVGLIIFEDDVIDLRVPLEQELLMGLPQHPLCSDACKGLCPECGADLNNSRCDCAPPVFHGGWASLKGFKVTKD